MIGIVSSASVVSAYVLTNYAIQTALLISVAFLVSSTPGIAGIVGSGDGERAATIRKQILTISWLINVILGTMILLWNRSFVALWVGPENYVGLLENLLMMLLCIQLVFIRHDANIIDVTLNIRRKVLLGALSAILSITLAYVLGSYVFPGVLGVVLGLLLGRSVLTISYPRLVSRALQAKNRDLGGWLRKALATALTFSTALFLAQRIELTNWFQLIVYAPPTFLPISIVSCYAGLSASERKHVVKRLGAISRLTRPRPQP
jgi:O-antigen/teichoic acid export membrane protein